MPAKIRLVVERGVLGARARGHAQGSFSTNEMKRRAQAMLVALQLKNEEVSLLLTDDEQIQKLNKEYRGKNKPTDVLAFAQREGEFSALAGNLLGDVIVSIPTAARQAKVANRDLSSEVTMLVAHGILHLLGWDHDTAAKDRRMRAETDRLCAAATRGRAKRSSKPAGAPKRAVKAKSERRR